MFFKEVRDKNKTPGRVYVYYMLVRSYRDELGVSRDKVLLNAGRLPYNRGELRRLATRIEEILSGRVALRSTLPNELERTAQELAARVLERQLKTGPDVGTDTPPEILSFDKHRLQTEDPRSIAGEQILATVAQALGLEESFQQAGLSRREGRLGTALTIAHALQPAPLPSLIEWLKKRSAIDEVLAESLHGLTLESAARLGRRLARRCTQIAATLRLETEPSETESRNVLDFRHVVSGPKLSHWFVGFQLGSHPLPRLINLTRIDKRDFGRVLGSIFRRIRGNAQDFSVVVLNQSPFLEPILRLAQAEDRPYLVLQGPAAEANHALRQLDFNQWVRKDGEWLLLEKTAASPGKSLAKGKNGGVPILRTNLPEPEGLAQALTQLAEIEGDLAAVQPQIDQFEDGPTPTFEAQLFLSYLALCLVRAFRNRLPRTEQSRPWQEFRELFASQTRLTIRVPDPFGSHTHYIRTTTQPTSELERLYHLLDLEPDLLGNRYFTA